jgi:hypothetical protein
MVKVKPLVCWDHHQRPPTIRIAIAMTINKKRDNDLLILTFLVALKYELYGSSGTENPKLSVGSKA